MPTKKVSPAVVSKGAVTSAPKKVAKKAINKRPSLVYTADAQAFWTSEGEILNSLLALRDALAKMPKSVFSHHVSARKNDFATWVDEVLYDADCARALRGAKTVAAAKKVVTEHLARYEI